MVILFQPKFSSNAMTDFKIFDEGGNVRAKVKYVCGISDSFVSGHFCEKLKRKQKNLIKNPRV
jgi:hypothetical protein